MIVDKIIITTVIIILNLLLALKYIKDKYVVNLIGMIISMFSFSIYICYVVFSVNMSFIIQNILLIFMFVLPVCIYCLEINRKNIYVHNIKKCIKNKEYTKVILKINKFIKKYGKDSYICYLLGISYKNTGEYIEARDTFSIATQLNSLDYKSYYELGNILDLTNKKETAIIMFNNSLKVKPDYYDAIEALGICYTSTKLYNDAIKVYKDGLNYHKKSYELYYNLAMLQMEVGAVDEALENFLQVLELKPTVYSASYNVGYIYYIKGDNDNAIKYYERARSSTLHGGRAYYELSKIYAVKNEIERAKTCLEYAILINPDYIKEAKVEIVFTNIKEYIYEYEDDLAVLENNKRRNKDYMIDERAELKKKKLLEKKIEKDIKENNIKLYNK